MFIFKETMRDLARHPARTLLVSILIAVLMVASAGIYAMSIDVRHTIAEIERTHSINVYLLRGLDQTSIETLLEQMQKDEAIARAEYVSPADGLAKLEAQYPQFASVFRDLTRNPIPPLIRVYPVSFQGIASLAAELRSLPGVQTVEYDEGSVQGMANANLFVHSLLLYVLVLAGFLFIAGFCLMAFSIINGKRKETAVLSIAGASSMQVLLATPAHLVAVWALASVLFAVVFPGVIRYSTRQLKASFAWVTPEPAGIVYAGAASVVLLASLACLLLACVIATLLAYRIDEDQRREEMLLE
ncbi:MAG: permease-like cell division protein FtsX [Caldiserica bacterium]|nr:permease-like cell division protein FtsX [Caldisericota bacterium]